MKKNICKIVLAILMACSLWTPFSILANDETDTPNPMQNEDSNDNEHNLSPVDVEVDKAIPSKTRASIPTSYDLRSSNQSTSVKDQNPYGACWTFGFISSLETNLIKKNFNNNSVDLSERAIGYFSFNSTNDPKGLTNGDKLSYTTPDNGNNNWYNGGGTATQASIMAKKGSGLLNESDAPYGNGNVSNEKEYNGINQKVKNAYYINSTDKTVIKEMIQTYGSGSLEFHATFDSGHFNNSTGAFFNDNENSDFVSNHEVSIIGWDDNYSKNNFSSSCRPKSNGAFLCKNSWGSEWSSMDGYFYISYEDACFTSANEQPVVFVETENKKANESTYQYDGTSLPERRIISSGTSIVTNYSIKDSSKAEKIKSISLLSYSTGVNYSIQVYENPIDKSKPLTGTPLLTVPTTGYITKAGYLNIDLNENIYANNGETVSIVITLTKSDGSNISLGVDKSGTYIGGDFGGWTSVNKTSPNQSLILYVNGRTTDLNSSSESVRVKMHTETTTGVKLNSTQKVLFLGDSATLSYKCYPSTNTVVSWENSSPDIASVDNAGNVVVKKTGTTIITITDNVGNTSTCVLTIKKATLTVNEKQKTLTPGSNYNIEFTSDPSTSSKTFTSSDTKVATVNNAGQVSAISNGTTSITVRDSYGNMDTCNITVVAPSITYNTYMQDKKWTGDVRNGTQSGFEGKRMEAIKISTDSGYQGEVQYQPFIQDKGWQGSYSSEGTVGGTTGQSKRIEAIKIRLTSVLATKYDVYYRVYVEDYGWMDWACNGEAAGTGSMSKRIEFIEIKLLDKDATIDGDTSNRYIKGVEYQSHIQDIGWQVVKSNGYSSGTTGKGKRVEAVKINLNKENSLSGSILYISHVQDIRWQDYVRDGALSGTTGKSKRIEAIKIKLSGDISDYYDVYYRVHVQDIGWQAWKKNDQVAGTTSQSKRIEAIQIKLVRKK